MKFIKKILYIVFAIILLSVGVNLFLGPHNIASGGVTGLAIILENSLGVQRSLIVFICNVIILLVTLIFLGKEVFFNTVIGAILLPIFIKIVPEAMLVHDTMLSMIVGSVIFGIAVSILYHNHASSGGTSIPPLILQKYLHMNPSIGLFLTDGAVVVLSLFVFDTDSFFYAITSIFITSAAMKYFETGLNKKKLIYIISDMNEAITQDILHNIGRGVTIVPVIGAYNKTQMKMIMVTMDTKDYRKLVVIVNKHDDKAFMITGTVSDVHGLGFTYDSATV